MVNRRWVLVSGLLLAAAAVWNCGSGSTSVVGPTGQARCGLTITPGTASVSASGGTGTLALATNRECLWTIVSSSDWISVTSVLTGQGPSTISFSAQPNRSASPRTGELIVGDQIAQISQPAAACSLTVSPVDTVVGAAGGEAVFAIGGDTFCSWTVTAPPDWIAATSPGGTGPTDLKLLIAANPGPRRTTAITIAGQIVTIAQASSAGESGGSCAFAAAPLSFSSVSASGAPVDITVTTQSGCMWTAVTGSPWITVATGASGSGTGIVKLIVAPNTGAARSGSATVAGSTVTVSQEELPCPYAISPGSFNPTAAGGSSPVTVTTSSGCTWTVGGLPSWVSVNGSGGTGSGSVTVTVQASLVAQRTALLTIAGQPFTVTQAGCRYDLSFIPLSFVDVAPSGSSASLSVGTTSGCTWPWTVGGLPAWITALPTSGAGPAATNVSLTIAANAGAPRSAQVVVAGETLSVTQQGCAYALNPTSLDNVPTAQTTSMIGLTTPSGCTWQWGVSGLPSWISASPSTGAGPVPVYVVLSIQANTGSPAVRNANLVIAGQPLSVSQAGCNYTLNPTSLSVPAVPLLPSAVGVFAPAGCSWTWSVAGLPPWITATPSGGAGPVPASVSLAIQPNLSTTPRSASFTIANQTLSVFQAGL